MKVVHLLICGAPAAKDTPDVVLQLQKAGWDVCTILSPQATKWVEPALLGELTGHAVRVDFRLPGEADPLPEADIILGIPLTFNTINKWVAGIGDTLVTSLLCEYLGRGTPPIVAVPCLKMDLVKHPAFIKNSNFLKEYGVTVLHEPERYKSPLMVPLDMIMATLTTVLTKNL